MYFWAFLLPKSFFRGLFFLFFISFLYTRVRDIYSRSVVCRNLGRGTDRANFYYRGPTIWLFCAITKNERVEGKIGGRKKKHSRVSLLASGQQDLVLCYSRLGLGGREGHKQVYFIIGELSFPVFTFWPLIL